uniref:Uncharacterized protein n=1 Tax=Geospiza parvula TaxID=87175 RepID=A0A8C3NPD7_GEOPR
QNSHNYKINVKYKVIIRHRYLFSTCFCPRGIWKNKYCYLIKFSTPTEKQGNFLKAMTTHARQAVLQWFTFQHGMGCKRTQPAIACFDN